jgi:hypothetical protein
MKKKVAKKNSKKTRFNYKQFLLGVLALFLFSFLLGFVNVGNGTHVANATGNAIFGGTGASSFVSDFFTNWQSANLDINVAKYVLFFILTLLIFSILRMTNFPPGGGLQFIIALLVSFLGVAYIAPEEVFVIVSTYTSLAVVLTSIIPFLVLCLFTTALVAPIRMNRGQNVITAVSLPNVLLSILVWLFFSIYSVVRLIIGLVSGALIWPAYPAIIMVVTTAVAFGFLFFNAAFRTFLAKVARSMMRVQRIAQTP